MIKVVLMAAAMMLAQSSAPQDFLAGFPDVVLAPGFAEDQSQRVVFDTCEGLILEAVAHGRGTVADVLGFYDTALAQLGWRRAESAPSRRVYVRDEDRLELEALSDGDRLTLRFFLQPVEQG